MSRKITIEYKGLQAILDKFDVMTDRGAASLIKAHARLCAVQLAHRTQPFSVGQKGAGEAYKQGVTRVGYDVERVIRSDKKLFEISDYIRDEKIQLRFRMMIQRGDYDSVIKILKATKIMIGFGTDAEILRSAGQMKPVHKSYRDKKSGRTRGKTDKFYVAGSQSRLDSYIKLAAARVGRTKAGWADCGRRMNAVKGDGARGIPAWAKSAKHGSNGEINDNSSVKPYGYVEMRNTAPWTSRILSQQDIKHAQTFATEMFVKSLKRAFEAAAKKTGSMQDHIDQEINQTNTGE